VGARKCGRRHGDATGSGEGTKNVALCKSQVSRGELRLVCDSDECDRRESLEIGVAPLGDQASRETSGTNQEATGVTGHLTNTLAMD